MIFLHLHVIKKHKTMKKILSIIAISLLLTGCEEAGKTEQRLSGDESTLPTELKGLKVYNVSCGEGNYVKVAILNNQVASTTYQVGKVQQSTIIVNADQYRPNQQDIYYRSDIISENDSIIVIRKTNHKK
jgi:uncharacterized lipoprotein YajG